MQSFGSLLWTTWSTANFMINCPVMIRPTLALNQTYSLPKISALVFRFFFFSTTVRGNFLLTSSRGALQRSLMTSGRSRAAFSHGSMGGRGVPRLTARWCRHWRTEKSGLNVNSRLVVKVWWGRCTFYYSVMWIRWKWHSFTIGTKLVWRELWLCWVAVPGSASGRKGWEGGGPWKCLFDLHYRRPPPTSWNRWESLQQTAACLEGETTNICTCICHWGLMTSL